MPGAEHPLISAHGTNTAPHLVSERLESEAAIRRGQRAREAVASSMRALGREEGGDGLLVTTAEELLKTAKRDEGIAGSDFARLGKMKAIDRIKKKQRAHPLV